jgi:hypothetical protein
MNKDDMILISVDDHIVEPPDMFKNHLREWNATTTPLAGADSLQVQSDSVDIRHSDD